ncbi:isopentenyl phosphate kinase [Natranaeroarchaeum aerophilus]|uniref:Isopentenyl phosphate kinase n=1 Tax=Natranaeroarchaeum aerophilus TaxID=2917711 RepID=A0AAE3K5F4_9EURY|nr:isopentenyl phosphate kinase [Natranaeroarchaeum aerophilus]MCL9813941.1 isopentenyl phosphate kinase [Natranaeroarchaeum aerophilus]
MTVVLKLGGSVVTDKDREETVDGESLDAAAAAIGDAVDDLDGLVVVHGGGSFGHPNAADYGVSTTEGTRDADGVLAIHGAMKTLNKFVLRRLREHDVPAVPVHPLSAASRDTGGELTLPVQQVRTLLGEGFVPVLHGDVIGHTGEGVTVVSGDELVVELAASVDADRVGLCSAVPGVLDNDDAVISRIEAYEDVAEVLGASDATDVTGGMAGKVRALLELDVEASIFDLDSVGPFLAGDRVGTTID